AWLGLSGNDVGQQGGLCHGGAGVWAGLAIKCTILRAAERALKCMFCLLASPTTRVCPPWTPTPAPPSHSSPPHQTTRRATPFCWHWASVCAPCARAVA